VVFRDGVLCTLFHLKSSFCRAASWPHDLIVVYSVEQGSTLILVYSMATWEGMFKRTEVTAEEANAFHITQDRDMVLHVLSSVFVYASL
jgi:hypothetical protein